MQRDLRVTNARLTPASTREKRTGLLGWIKITLGDALIVDGIALRMTRDKRLVLSFPARHDSAGRPHAIVRPTDTAARDAITAEILTAIKVLEATS